MIAKLNNGKAAVIVGNGYNSVAERGVLFIIDLETGALIRKIDTHGRQQPQHQRLASPRGWDNDGNGTLDTCMPVTCWAIWKFDLLGHASKLGHLLAQLPSPSTLVRGQGRQRTTASPSPA
jgi:type IV pilus assembly protein PilY1